MYPERIYKIVVALLSCLKFQQKSEEKPLVLEEFVFILSLAVQEEEERFLGLIEARVLFAYRKLREEKK